MTGPADDDELLARLAATLRGAQQPPADVDELARASFGLRDLDAQLAELVADSAVDVPAGVRSSPEAPRLLTFAAADAEVELQVMPARDGWAVLGQVVPPGPALVRAEPAAPAGRSWCRTPTSSGASPSTCPPAGPGGSSALAAAALSS